MKANSIKITNGGNKIELSGSFADSFFKAACDSYIIKQEIRHTHVNNGVNDNCKECGRDLRDDIHYRACKSCGCRIDHNGCGCNPPDA